MFPTFEIVRSNLPSVAVARYVAIRSVSFQTHLVLPPLVTFETRTPFAIAVSPSGTAMLKSNRLVAGVVVARVPRGRALGLVHDERAVVGRHPSLDRII